MLFHPSIYFIALVLRPRIAFLNCTVTTRHIHTHAHTHTHTKHTWGNIPRGKSSISFMAFSGKVSSSPIKRLPSLHPRISFLYFHLYQFWFTSENDPLRPINFNHFFPIPPRDNWSKLESGIFAWTRPDKPFFFSKPAFPPCPQCVRLWS